MTTSLTLPVISYDTAESRDQLYHPQKSDSTSSREVLETAVDWISRCKCANKQQRTLSSTRLINLRNLKQKYRLGPHSVNNEDYERIDVYLVETVTWLSLNQPLSPQGFDAENPLYVTLSYCSGHKPNTSHKLTHQNYEEYLQGAPVSEFPKIL